MSGFSSAGYRRTGIPPAGTPTGLLPADEAHQFAPPPPLLSGRSPDISNWDHPTFDATCFREAGVRRAIVGCQYPGIARQQVRALLAQDIPVQLYAFLYFGSTQPEQATRDAVAIAREFNLPVVWLDAEADANVSPAPTPASRNAQLARCVQIVEAAGLIAGVYTAPWWWVPKHADTAQFSDLPLWYANYGRNDCAQPPIRAVSFGGWTYCVIHQYCSTDGFCGRPERDANYVWADAPGWPDSTSEGQPMTPAERAEFDALRAMVSDLANIIVRNGIDLTGDGTVDLTGDAALRHAVANGWSAFLGINLARAQASRAEVAIVKHLSNHPGGGSTAVPHTHDVRLGTVTTGPSIPLTEEPEQ